MCRATVERVKPPRKIRNAVIGRLEVIKIRVGHTNFPLPRISFVVAHDGSKRRRRQEVFNLREPILPLRIVFAVVDQITDVDKKIRVGVFLERKPRHVAPRVVAVAALRIGEKSTL